MNKTLWLDFDNTIADSISAFLKTYNALIEDTGKEYSQCYNFEDCGVKNEHINKIFDTAYFFTVLNPYDNAIEMIKKLSEITEVNICTIGTWKNIKAKITWLEWQGLDKVVGFVPIVKAPNYPLAMNKKIIHSGVILDDNPKCLESSNANDKIMFTPHGLDYDWQKGYKSQYRVTEWNEETYQLLLKLIKEDI